MFGQWTDQFGQFQNYKIDFRNSLAAVYISSSLYSRSWSPITWYYRSCISMLSTAETRAALVSSNGPVRDITIAPSGAVTTIARTATVNSCNAHTTQVLCPNFKNNLLLKLYLLIFL